ncbi:hypothetical protein Enr13x_50930 [Stieleria neptunia]|uniref:DUF1772 domain-containing protein n=1 Tax=Stieleria neptunia TaxID=2527979 RepID=A0A518HWI2_9BACT|nr:hypothetical protein [Stieleria neptunia]QDV45218.1 hypothetical protein Enr13x_50930 [Stieleria neptunia]
MNANLVFLVNLVATWYMVGLIWMVQIVHYKMFDRVGEAEFVKYEIDHSNLITPIVGPPMLIEIATAGMLLALAPAGIPRWALVTAFLAAVAIWLSTAFIQVPCHNRLTQHGFSQADYQLLVGSNWIRTILWTARGLLLAYFANKLISS